MAQEKVKAPPAKVFVMKMTPALAASLSGRPHVWLALPRKFAIGDRILLREFNGAPTGRADLCTVVEKRQASPTPDVEPEESTCLRRGWCWSREAPESLEALSLAISDEVFPLLTVPT